MTVTTKKKRYGDIGMNRHKYSAKEIQKTVETVPENVIFWQVLEYLIAGCQGEKEKRKKRKR